MAENIQVTGMSKEEVAYTMTMHFLSQASNWNKRERGMILDLYADCLEATSGKRKKSTMAGGIT